MQKIVFGIVCLVACAYSALAVCNYNTTYTTTFVPDCTGNALYIKYPNYQNQSQYYACNGYKNPKLTSCPEGQYFSYVLQVCGDCDSYLPPVACENLKGITPNCQPIPTSTTAASTTAAATTVASTTVAATTKAAETTVSETTVAETTVASAAPVAGTETTVAATTVAPTTAAETTAAAPTTAAPTTAAPTTVAPTTAAETTAAPTTAAPTTAAPTTVAPTTQAAA